MAHIHAESMAQFAEDAKQNDFPWENWQWKTIKANENAWANMVSMPNWYVDNQYRRKPKIQQVRFLIQDGTNAVTEFVIPVPQIPMRVFTSDLVAMIKEKYNV
jgi:hypothetical protein